MAARAPPPPLFTSFQTTRARVVGPACKTDTHEPCHGTLPSLLRLVGSERSSLVRRSSQATHAPTRPPGLSAFASVQLQDHRTHFLLAPGCYRDKALEGQQDQTAYLAPLDRIHSSACLGERCSGVETWDGRLTEVVVRGVCCCFLDGRE